MKHTLLLLSLFIVSILTFGQSNNQYGEESPNAGVQSSNLSNDKGGWQLQFSFPVNTAGTAGCETDGTNFYVARWNTDTIYKYSQSGTLLSSFKIAGVSALRDLAYDGTYFYGGSTTASIYKMDFAANPPALVSTITCPSGTQVRHIAYDPTADNNNGGFWVGNWATNIILVSRTGALLNTITSANHAQTSIYGSAYDNISPGGPFLWVINANSAVNTTITQIKISTGMPTGTSKDLVGTVCNAGELGGGLFLKQNVISGTTTLGGLIQNVKLFGFNLASTQADTFDIGVSELTMLKYNPNNANVNVSGKIKNFGLATTTSYKINYSVDNGPVVTQAVTGASIASNTVATFVHSTAITPVVGNHTVKVWTTEPNGVADQYAANDTMSYSFIVYDITNAVQRRPLMEVFTSSSCAPCVAGNQNLTTVLGTNNNTWTCVKYQMSWPGNGDPYYTAEGGTRRTYYGVNAVPDMYIDGPNKYFPTNLTTANVTTHKTTPAFVNLTATYSIGAPVVDVNVTIDPKINITSSNLKLFMAVIENKTTKNTATNGETEFHYVMKKLLPDANGIPVSALTAGTTVTKFQHYAFKGNYRLPANALSPINHSIENSVEEFSDLSVVVWLQDATTKEVYQSAWATLVAGVDENANGNGIIGMFPNPATNEVNVRYNVMETKTCEINIFNSFGQLVKTINKGELGFGDYTETINLDGLSSGIYFVSVKIGENTSSTKLIVE